MFHVLPELIKIFMTIIGDIFCCVKCTCEVSLACALFGCPRIFLWNIFILRLEWIILLLNQGIPFLTFFSLLGKSYLDNSGTFIGTFYKVFERFAIGVIHSNWHAIDIDCVLGMSKSFKRMRRDLLILLLLFKRWRYVYEIMIREPWVDFCAVIRKLTLMDNKFNTELDEFWTLVGSWTNFSKLYLNIYQTHC